MKVVGLVVLHQSTVWSIPHLQDIYVDLNNNSIGAIARNTNSGSSSHNNNNSSSTVLLLHHCSKLLQGHHSSSHLPVLRATVAGRSATLLESTAK
jgi:hypothetical protein